MNPSFKVDNIIDFRIELDKYAVHTFFVQLVCKRWYKGFFTDARLRTPSSIMANIDTWEPIPRWERI